MAPVPDGASELPRSKPKTASRKRFAWRLYPFTTTSPTWATITALNAPATVPSKPPRTPLINSPASFIISLKLGSLMMKLFLQSLKLVTKNTVCTSYKLSLGKWVTHSCRPMRDPQFLERGMHRKGGSHAASIKPTVADHIRRHPVDLDLLDRSKPSVPSSGRSASGPNRRKNPYCSKHQAGSRRCRCGACLERHCD